MNTILWIVAVLLVIIGLAGIVLPMLPGTVLVFAGLLIAAWADVFEKVGWVTIAVLGALTALSLLVDIAASGAGVKRAGASKQAVIGAVIGAVAGRFGTAMGLVMGAAMKIALALAMVGIFAVAYVS